MESFLLRRPSAFTPVAISLTAWTFVLVYVATFGIVHQADEGTPAHIFQLLIVGQMPIVAFFALKWLPRQPKGAAMVIAIQAAAAALAVGTVALLEL